MAPRLFTHASALNGACTQLLKGLDYDKIGDKFGFGASTAYGKVHTAGADEDLFNLVSGHGTRVLPLELVHGAKSVLGHQQKATYVQTGAHACPGTKHRYQSEQGLSSSHNYCVYLNN